MLTCKSLFGLGYRGERLIEPSALVVDRAGGIVRNVQALVLLDRKKQGDTVKLPGNPAAFSRENAMGERYRRITRREARQAPRRKPRVG